MSATELAADLGVGRTTVWRWTRAGLLPAPTKLGRQSVYDSEAIAAAASLARAMEVQA